MEKISFIKKLLLFRDYWKLIKRNKENILDKTNGLNLRLDRAGRIYTVYNCPEEVKNYGTNVAEKYIREYIARTETLFINLGLVEYIGIRDIKQLNDLDFLVVFGFNGFDTRKFFNRVIFSSIFLTGGSLLTYFFIL